MPLKRTLIGPLCHTETKRTDIFLGVLHHMTATEQQENQRLAELFKALSHPVRVQLLRRLASSKRYCGDLVTEFGLAQSTISHHLRILREAGLICVEEQGTRTCYSIDRDKMKLIGEKFALMRAW